MIPVKPHSCVEQLIISDLILFVGSCITLELRSHVIGVTTHELDLIQLAVPYTHIVFLLYYLPLTFQGVTEPFYLPRIF